MLPEYLGITLYYCCNSTFFLSEVQGNRYTWELLLVFSPTEAAFNTKYRARILIGTQLFRINTLTNEQLFDSIRIL